MNYQIGNVVTFVVGEEKQFWIYSPIDYLVMSDWSQWGIQIDDENRDKIYPDFFNTIQDFIVSNDNLTKILKGASNDHERYFSLPLVIIDFSKKELYSNYFDRALETHVLNDWKGEYRDVLDLIPDDYRYWESNETVLL